MERTASDPNTPYTEEQFCAMFSDFVVGASYTQDSFITFAILLLATHPHVQEKVYQEIRSVVGLQVLPDATYKSKYVKNEYLIMTRILLLNQKFILKSNIKF